MSPATAELVEKSKSSDFTSLVTYSVTQEGLNDLSDRLTGLTCDTKDGYELVRKGIVECTGLRSATEKRRVELKADALAYGRLVDSTAKDIIAKIEAIENPLRASKKAVDDEEARVKREKLEAEQRRLEAERKAAQEAEEARLKAIRDAEEAKLAEERRLFEIEKSKLAEAQAKIDEANRIERERLEAEKAKQDAEQAAIRAEKERLDRIEFERQAKERAEKEAEERVKRELAAAEQKRIADELAAKQKAEADRIEAERIEAMKPDVEKVRDFGRLLGSLELPDVQSKEAKAVLAAAFRLLDSCSTNLLKFSA